MRGQLSMDDIARARDTDPETSKAAAASIQGLTAARAYVLSLLSAWGPLTDDDLANIYAAACGMGADVPMLSPSGLRTRRAELVKAGLVKDTGDRGRTASGRPAIMWSLV